MKDSDQPTGVAAGLRDGLPKPGWSYEDFPDDAAEVSDAPAAKLISLGDINAAIKRSKRFWCIAAAVGFLLGCALFISTKPSYQVTVAVLITNDPSQDPVTQQATNQLLAQSPTLAKEMVQKLGLDETPTAFLKTYSVTVVSNQVLAISIGAPTAELATDRAAALATEFLQYRAQTLLAQESTIFTAENQQLTQEEQTVSSLNKQVSQFSAGSAADQGTSLAALQAKQTKATAMVAALQATVASDQASTRITTTSMISGSSILSSSPAAPVNSPKKTLLEYVVGGLLGGLVVGMGWIAVRTIVTDRLRLRSDIAEALGAPVRISVPATGTGGRSLPGRRATGEADGGIRRVVGYLRNAVPGNARGPATLAIIAVDNTKTVAAIVADLATTCAHEGKRVLVADLSGGALAAQLGEAKPGIQTITVNSDRIMLAVPSVGDVAAVGPLSRRGSIAAASNGIASAYAGADILITLAVLDPGVGADHLSTWASEAVAVVTAGESTTVKIHATGEMIRGAGIHLASAVLLGTDRADESLGTVG